MNKALKWGAISVIAFACIPLFAYAVTQSDIDKCHVHYEAGNYEKAFPICKRVAEQTDDDTAQNNLGWMYFEGESINLVTDHQKAAYWIKKAATGKDSDKISQFNFGFLLFHGYGIEQSYENSFKWFLKSSESGSARSPYYVGFQYFYGLGIEQNYEEALKWFLISSERENNVKSQYYIAAQYYSGLGTSQDYKEALEWFKKAAVQNEAISSFNLGIMYMEGQGVQKDFSTAMRFFEEANEIQATNCFSSIQYYNSETQKIEVFKLCNGETVLNLGYLYTEGSNGIQQDKERAMEYYLEAAAYNNAKADFNLGVMYLSKDEKDDAKAKEWFQRAAQNGNLEAIEILKEME